MTNRMPIVLTVAGSDSGGGAGIQADLKTFQSCGVYGTSVVVAVTAQNTRGVTHLFSVPSVSVSAQIDALITDLLPDAWKSGMLGTSDMIDLMASTLDRLGSIPYVLDPVMVATSGDRLLLPEATEVLIEKLLHHATVVTPNLDEAEALVGFPVRDPAGMRRAGQTLLAKGAAAVLITGGHLVGDDLLDLLVTPSGGQSFTHTRIPTRATHGTGCTLSAAITAGLAHGFPLVLAVERSIAYLRRAISQAPGLGNGHGPIRHGVRYDVDDHTS